jgi:hypothetical protein
MRLQADRRLLRVDPDREVVERHLDDVPPYLVDVVGIVGQRLRVGEEEELAVGVLERHAVPEGARVVAKVKRPGGPVAGEDDGGRHVRISVQEERDAARG